MRKEDNKFHGEPCRLCGKTLRYIKSKTCVGCRTACARMDYAYMPEAHLAATRDWRRKNIERHNEMMRVGQLRRKFGLSAEEYEALVVRHGGVCGICKRPCPTGRRLAVDHDHMTKKVRGLLCQSCNTGIGKFGDDPERLVAAARYILWNSGSDAIVEVIHRPEEGREIPMAFRRAE